MVNLYAKYENPENGTNYDKEEAKELFIVKSMADFEENSVSIAEEFLESFYMIPKILKVYGKKDKFGRLNIDVLTDIGDRTIILFKKKVWKNLLSKLCDKIY